MAYQALSGTNKIRGKYGKEVRKKYENINKICAAHEQVKFVFTKKSYKVQYPIRQSISQLIGCNCIMFGMFHTAASKQLYVTLFAKATVHSCINAKTNV